MEFGKLLSWEKNINQVILSYEKQQAILSVIKEDIINVFVPCWKKNHYSKAIEGDKTQPVEWNVAEDDGKIILTTSKLKAVVGENFSVDFYKADGTPLMQEYHGERKKGMELSQKSIRLLESEGHDISKLTGEIYPLMTMMKLDKEDKFYGLGDKSGFLNKRSYEYINWNSDIPQAHNEDYRSLYKSVPFLICLKEQGVYGVFFDNTFRSCFNLGKESQDYFFYGADDGNLDYYFMGGNSMAEVIGNYTYLTGRTPLPQLWTLGYQQSRWGYECAEDIEEVTGKYRELQIPCDVIHFDIDYMEDFKVFTWDEKEYKEKGQLIGELKEKGFKPITIIDPGTKAESGYFMDEEGLANDYFAKDTEGNVYVNEVWPGESHYPDFGRKEVRKWWGDHHKFLTDMGVCGVWNDMNEPASFKGELPLDVVFHDEERTTNHAEMHNVYGHYMCKSTFEGLQNLTGKRPFVITRACYAGTQKYSTVWTGDNQSLWSHLQMLVPQLCNLGMSGFSFAGTDIGGFGAEATPELLSRWIEAAVFSPLFRNHSAKGGRRQEPWQFGEEVININRKYIELRYQFLPYLYDLFYQGEKTGLPVMRPLVLHYANDKNTHNMNGEFLVGENILVAPVLEQGADKKMVYLPEGTWYDYWTGEAVEGSQYILRDAPIDVCPIYIKAGSIIPMYDCVQYVGEQPYNTLYLLTTPGAGTYQHFRDNGTDYEYQNGKYILYHFSKDEQGNLVTEVVHDGYEAYKQIVVRPLGNK